jgi:hypothetical protein
LLVAGLAGKVLGTVEKVAVVTVKEGRKLIAKFTPPVAKAPTPGSRELSALDLATKGPPKKAITFKSSGEPAAKSVVKPTSTGDVAPPPVQKPSSSTTKASTSYERTSSYPASSSSSRSPQAPSTAPPAAVKTTAGPVRKTATPSSSTPVGRSASSSSKAKGVHNPKTKKSLDYGNQKHREFDESLPKSLEKKGIRDRTKKLHVPDKHTETMVHELKPGTVTGVKKGLQQLKRYEEASGKPGLLHVYEPEGKPIDLDAIVQKNFRDDPVVQKVLENP